MRKSPKSSLGSVRSSIEIVHKAKHYDLSQNCLFIGDDGYLIQHAIWSKPYTYAGVCQTYTSHILNHFGVQTTAVFDLNTSTKQAEQRRRAERCASSDIMFDENMPTTTSQANSKKKQRLIEIRQVEQKTGGRGRGREYNNLPFKMHCDSIITRSCWIGD